MESIITVLRKQSPAPCPYLRLLDITSSLLVLWLFAGTDITATGAVSIHKLVRRTDGIINVKFDCSRFLSLFIRR